MNKKQKPHDIIANRYQTELEREARGFWLDPMREDHLPGAIQFALGGLLLGIGWLSSASVAGIIGWVGVALVLIGGSYLLPGRWWMIALAVRVVALIPALVAMTRLVGT